MGFAPRAPKGYRAGGAASAGVWGCPPERTSGWVGGTGHVSANDTAPQEIIMPPSTAIIWLVT